MSRRTVSEITAAIEQHNTAAAARRAEMEIELVQAQKSLRFECDKCHRAVKVGEAVVIQDLEFRCPGQSGGYFINAGRSFKCPNCGGTTNPYGQPEVYSLPNSVFHAIEEVELP